MSDTSNVRIGSIVNYVLNEGDVKTPGGVDLEGEIRPAIVVNHFGSGNCNLQVFLDGDGADYNDGLSAPLLWATSIGETTQADKRPGTWHFPND